METSHNNILPFLIQAFQNKETRALFSDAVRLLPQIVFTWAPLAAGMSLYHPEKLAAFTGFEEQELARLKTPLDLVFSADHKFAEDHFSALHSAPHQIHCFPVRLLHKNEAYRHALLHATSFYTPEAGDAVAFIFTVQDNHEKAVLEETIRSLTSGTASRQNHQPKTDDGLTYKELLTDKESFLNQGSWETNLLNGETVWSNGMFHIFGYETDPENRDAKVSGHLHDVHLSEEELSRNREDWDRALTQKDNYVRENPIITIKGERKYVETYGKIIRNGEGIPEKVVGTTRDITPLQEYKKNLEDKINELNHRNSELEGFAYIASHDLQEPLRKLTAFSDRLQSKFGDKLGDEGKLYLDRMAAAAENMRILIDDLLEFSRTARSENHFSKQDMTSLLKAAMSDLEVKIEESEAIIEATALPVIDVIPVQIKRLFVNLLSNSIKFKNGGQSPVIRISCDRLTDPEKKNHGLQPGKEYIRLTVQDNGIGFENEYAEKIFQIFQRLHGKHEYPGSGIGLAICKKIVENHNGIIYAKSEQNQGSLFIVILPENQH